MDAGANCSESSLLNWFAPGPEHWVRADEVVALPGAEIPEQLRSAAENAGESTVLLEVAGNLQTLRGQPPGQFLLREASAEAVSSTDFDAALVGISDPGVGEIITVSDGEAAFPGVTCSAELEQHLRAFAASLTGDEAITTEGAVEALIGDENTTSTAALEDWVRDQTAGSSAEDWYALSPDERQIHPGQTPREVFDDLEPVRLEFDVPESWTTADIRICPQNSIGWTDCVASSAFTPEEGLEYTLDLLTYAVPGESLDIWALPRTAGFNKASGANLITLDAVTMSAASRVRLTSRTSDVEKVRALEISFDPPVVTAER